jgi:high-affinity iron transporter
MNGLSIALQSGHIALREGLGATLIISVMAAFVRHAGVVDEVKALYVGAAFAVLACFEVALIFEAPFDGAHRARFDAVVVGATAVLMLAMSGHISLQEAPTATNAAKRRFAKRAVSTGMLASLALIAFLAVFRHGNEVASSLHALSRSSGGWNASVNVGLAAALVCFALIYAAVQWLAAHLPVRSAFRIASAFLFIMGLRLVGDAVWRMQEHVLVPYDAASVPDWLVLVGFNPSWEAIGTQILIAVIAVGGTSALRLRRPVSLIAAE